MIRDLNPCPPVPAAIAKCIRALLELQVAPKRLTLACDADDFRERAELIRDFAMACDGVFAAIGAEGADHTHLIAADEFENVVSDAASDRALAHQFENAAERMSEDHAEFASDRKGFARASLLGVD